MRKYVIMGVQGSGKGTHAAMLAEDLDLVHIGVGDILRWNVQHHTKLGAQIRRTMAAGNLVPDEVIEGVVSERLGQHDWNYGFIIDGFPRSERQAEFFLESYDIDGVIHLDLPDTEVRRRVLARRLCSGCGMDYNPIASSPRGPRRRDAGGAPLSTREGGTAGSRPTSRREAPAEAFALGLGETHAKPSRGPPILGRKEYVVPIDAGPAPEQIQREIGAGPALPPSRGPAAPDPVAAGPAELGPAR